MAAATAGAPKCLAPLRGRRLLEWQLAALGGGGMQRVVAIGGYRADSLRLFVEVAYVNDRWSETNMVRSLMAADDLLSSETCIVSYSDIVYHPTVVAALAAAPGDITMLYDEDWLPLWAARFENPLEDAETFRSEDGLLQEIGGRTRDLTDIKGQYLGLFRLTPVGWAQLQQVIGTATPEGIDRMDMTSLFSRVLGAGFAINAVPVRGRWCEVDSQSDLRVYEAALNQAAATGTRWSHDWT